MTWASRRRTIYISILILFFLGVAYIIARPYLKDDPTCFDYKQNGNETGIDCGGSCNRACVFEVDKLSVIWTRIFKVVDGRFNAVAYLENQNKNAAVANVKYRFRFADENNVYVGSREGETAIPPSGRFAIFEPFIGLGHSIPVYASFEFLEAPLWVNVEKEKLDKLKISTSNIVLENTDTKPRMTAVVKNNSLYTVPNLELVTILYDKNGNVVSSSSTFLEVLRGEEERTINYTWAEPFDREVIVKEIIPIYNIFLSELR